jgi:hypothetical protein
VAEVTTCDFSLLLLQVDGFVVVPRDADANLDWRLTLLGQAVGVERFFGTGGALGAVKPLIATAQAGVAKSPIAAAVAGKLVEDVADFARLLIDVNLPGITEILAGQLGAGEDGRQSADLQGCGGVIGGNFVCRIGPLGIAGEGESKDGKKQAPTILGARDHKTNSLC